MLQQHFIPTGLTSQEAEEKRKEYGLNTIVEERRRPFLSFILRFWTPIAWMLELILILQIVLLKYDEACITLFLLVFNAVVGFSQEEKAKKVLALLRNKLQIKARVLRDGIWQEVDATEIVPQDIIRVRLGDFIPADITIVDGSILVDQSMITGEAMPLERITGDRVYSGSIVKGQAATGLVTATGKRSFFGKTVDLVTTAKTESYLETVVLKIVKALVILDVILVLIFFAYAYVKQIPLLELAPYSLVILIASVPVALPAAFTLMRAVASQTLAEKGILVTKLTSIEEAASMDTLFTDKTGTLTQNELSLINVVPIGGVDRDTLLRYASFASEAASQDPIDIAILKAAKDAHIAEYKGIRQFIPFDPVKKRTEAVIEEDGKELYIVKGAPGVLVEDTDLLELAKKLSSSGDRVVVVGVGSPLQFIGFLVFSDPPRKESKRVIEELHQLQVAVKMVTGDNACTAQAIALKVGIGSRTWEREKILTPNDLQYDIFAGVYPQDKYMLVEKLQKQGSIVGMTGDGVNDAPALKKANMGVAVSTATDVAKAAASIVLTFPGLELLVDAIKLGRDVYRRMLTYTLNKIVKTAHITLFLVFGFFFYDIFITTPLLVMLLIFVNDFITMSLAYDIVRPQPTPCRWDIKFLLLTSISLAAAWLAFSFLLVHVGREYFELSLARLHTWVFLLLAYSGLATVYIVRTRLPLWTVAPGAPLLICTLLDIVIVSFFAYFGIFMHPIELIEIALLILSVFGFMVLLDLIKGLLFNKS
ncbi:MAG: plasma-membrane proton-efflux P-type ATPase [Verrucomicrobia bacterium]|nr:plasma-membrane proton-efflux P-type ATPase [Verrucomicrobiota bacterium]